MIIAVYFLMTVVAAIAGGYRALEFTCEPPYFSEDFLYCSLIGIGIGLMWPVSLPVLIVYSALKFIKRGAS